MNLYFDESGNTGDNLLDINQPYFCLASNNYSEDEAEKLLSYITTQADEIHFKTLIKSKTHQNSILKLFNDDLIGRDRIIYTYADKAFALLIRLVDALIEPHYFNYGIDFYGNQDNKWYSYALYFDLKNENKLIEYINLFQLMIRKRTEQSINQFYDFNNELFSTTKSDYLKAYLFLIAKSKSNLDHVSFKKYSLDLATTSCLSIISTWNTYYDNIPTIIHDESKPIAENKTFLDKYRDKNEVDRMNEEYGLNQPLLRYSDIILADSKNHIQLQISDLIASTITYVYKIRDEKGLEDRFVKEFLETKLAKEATDIYSILPTGIANGGIPGFNTDKFQYNFIYVLEKLQFRL